MWLPVIEHDDSDKVKLQKNVCTYLLYIRVV
jgi:hypothetical protein